MRDHSPTYMDGAYCAWIPPIRSSVAGMPPENRSSKPCRASSARLSARGERTSGSGMPGTLTRRRGGERMRMTVDEARSLFATARVARLGTVTPDGAPHVVPVVFALTGDTLVFAVDAKPKRTQDLQRLRNLVANPRATFLVDEYAEEWSGLWWARADGSAVVLPRPTTEWQSA